MSDLVLRCKHCSSTVALETINETTTGGKIVGVYKPSLDACPGCGRATTDENFTAIKNDIQ